MNGTWYGKHTDVEGAPLGGLAVIAPLLNRMGVAGIIDQHLPVDQQADFPHGTILSLLIAARAHEPVALSNVSDWAKRTMADLFFGMPLEKINDDRLGRSLDAFFDQRHSILSSIALKVVEEFNVPLRDLHYDPTHVLFTGAYEQAQARDGAADVDAKGCITATRSDSSLKPAHVTKGRAMDDAPNGSKMIHVGLSVHVDEYGPLPLFGHTIDGNQNGHTSVQEHLALMSKHLPTIKVALISDRGTYSIGHLLRLEDAGCQAIASAPWDEFRDLFDAHREKLKWQPASYLSIEQKSRRERASELPLEHYDLAVLKHTLKDEKSDRTIGCRVLFVKSTADEKATRKQRQKQIDRLTKELLKLQMSVASGRRNTDVNSVSKRVHRAYGASAAAKYFRWELIDLTPKEIKALPRPAKGCRPPTQRFEFQFDKELLAANEQYDGYNAIVTTVPLEQSSGDEIFTRFKQQTFSEQVNSHLKGPLAVRPVWLKSAKRIESLMFLLVIALMLHYLIQRTYRASLALDGPFSDAPLPFSDSLIKEQRITTQTLLGEFKNYTLLVERHGAGRSVSPTRLTPRQAEILRRLKLPTPSEQLRRLLPRAPE